MDVLIKNFMSRNIWMTPGSAFNFQANGNQDDTYGNFNAYNITIANCTTGARILF